MDSKQISNRMEIATWKAVPWKVVAWKVSTWKSASWKATTWKAKICGHSMSSSFSPTSKYSPSVNDSTSKNRTCSDVRWVRLGFGLMRGDSHSVHDIDLIGCLLARIPIWCGTEAMWDFYYGIWRFKMN